MFTLKEQQAIGDVHTKGTTGRYTHQLTTSIKISFHAKSRKGKGKGRRRTNHEGAKDT
jgi:hypothetical protein